MPRYVYRCEGCNITFQKAHSIKEKLTDCEKCGIEGSLSRIPSMPFVFSEADRPGKLVDEHIEEAKKELMEEKENLKKVEHE
jgi:putative FmdB family regulatory protein